MGCSPSVHSDAIAQIEPEAKTTVRTAEESRNKGLDGGKRVWVTNETEDIKKHYTFGRVLGKGQFGTTRLVIHKTTGAEFACKSISKRKLTSPVDIEDARREVQIMHHLKGHPLVVKLYTVFEDKQYLHLVMERCSGGELFGRIIAKGAYSERDAAAVFRSILQVIAHCHAMGVMHRDIKPENFLLLDDTDNSPIKSTDFGLSMFFQEGQEFSEIVGSAFYVAPEVLKKRYSKQADLWSCGVMLYILLCGVPPFYGETEQKIFKAVMVGRPNFSNAPWPSISAEAKQVVQSLLIRDPSKRATAEQLLAHPWVRADGSAPDAPLNMAVMDRLKGFAAMNKLKREALRIIACNLPADEILGLRKIFEEIDADGSGSITVEELREGLHRKGSKIPEEELVQLLKDADANGDGSIDYEEFLAATIHQSKLEHEDGMYKAFQHFDTDGTGFIDQAKLRTALARYGETADIDAILKQVDTDGDGRIDYEEFCNMMRDTDITVVNAKQSLRPGLNMTHAFSSPAALLDKDDEEVY